MKCIVGIKKIMLIVFLQYLSMSVTYAGDKNAERGWQSPLLRDHVLVGKIVDLHSGETITETELIHRLKASRYILMGEKHDNMDHHVLEGSLLNVLLSGLAQDKKPAVVFEMLDDSQQDGVKKLSAGDSLKEMKNTLQWDDKGWDWESYGPLFKQTLELDAELVAGNVSAKQLRAIYQSGMEALEPDRFGSMSVLSREQRAVMQQQIYDSHCEMMPFDSLMPMVNVQMAKDASLAHAMVAQPGTRIVLIAGGFHVARDIGVPNHLQQLAPDSPMSVLMFVEVTEGANAVDNYPSALVDVADYIWFTPKATDKDYCESLRKHKTMKKD